MKKEEIHFLDIKRWLFGQTPPEFMIEVLIRTALIYIILIVAVRLMGKRMTGQITITELAVMVTLGAIVSPVMQLPDRGVLFGIISLMAALLFQKGITLMDFRNKKVEHMTQGEMSMMVKDGVLILEELEKSNISKQQFYAMLRQKKIENLGKVKRAYLEACGVLSVYESKKEVIGLPIFPPFDKELTDKLTEVDHSMMACCNCGHVQQVKNKDTTCELCNKNEWSKAYLAAKE